MTINSRLGGNKPHFSDEALETHNYLPKDTKIKKTQSGLEPKSFTFFTSDTPLNSAAQ